MDILDDIAKDMEAKLAKLDKIEKENQGHPNEGEVTITPEEWDKLINDDTPLTREQKVRADEQDRKDIAEIELSGEYQAFRAQHAPVVQARIANDGNLPLHIAREKKTWKHRDTTGVNYFYRNKRWYENEVLTRVMFEQPEIDKVHAFGFQEMIKALHKKYTKSFRGKLELKELQLYIVEWLEGRIKL